MNKRMGGYGGVTDSRFRLDYEGHPLLTNNAHNSWGIYTFYCDGATDGICFIVKDTPTYKPLRQRVTNNQAEYIAVISAMAFALMCDVKKIEIITDSLLVVSQLDGTYKTRNPLLKRLHKTALILSGRFDECEFQWCPRECNPAGLILDA